MGDVKFSTPYQIDYLRFSDKNSDSNDIKLQNKR